jgi:NTP pyrophosphatase (non-canonical NTP hydrolase)
VRRSLREYSRQVQLGLDVKEGVDPLLHCVLGLAGEAGEVADLVKKSQYLGGSLDREHLMKELGDVLWYFTHILYLMGWSFLQIMLANIFKLEQRRGAKYSWRELKMAHHEDDMDQEHADRYVGLLK